MKHLRTLSTAAAYTGAFLYLQLLPLQQALAVYGGPDPNIDDLGSGDVRTTVQSIISYVLSFLALIAVIFVIVGGFRIMMAGGNEENVTKGRKTIIYAIVGLVIIFFAQIIVKIFTSGLSTGNFTP